MCLWDQSFVWGHTEKKIGVILTSGHYKIQDLLAGKRLVNLEYFLEGITTCITDCTFSLKLDVFPQHSHVVPGETKVGKWVAIYRLKRVRCVLLCRNILIHLCVMWCLLMETQCTSRHLWMVLIKRMFFQWRQSNARDVHSTAHTHTHTDQQRSNLLRYLTCCEEGHAGLL